MWGEIDLTERKTEERKIDKENEREKYRVTCGREGGTEIQR